jgi:hypothetical protein
MSNFRWATLITILLAAFALRVAALDQTEIGGDEAFSYDFISRSYAGIVQATLDMQEPHPPGSYFIQKAAMTLFGGNEFSLRFISVVFSMAAIALAFSLGRMLLRMRGTSVFWAAVIAMALMAGSAFALRHGRELRMYAMQLALTLACAAFAWRAWQRRRTFDFVAFGACAWLAMHVHYYSAAALLAINLYWLGYVLVCRIPLKRERKWIATQFFLAATCAPWLLLASGTLGSYPGNADIPTLWDGFTRGLGAMFLSDRLGGWRVIAAVLAAAFTIAGALRLWRDGRRESMFFLLIMMLLPLVLAWLAAQSRPIFRERYFVTALPYFFLLAAAAVVPALRPAKPAMRLRTAAAVVLFIALVGVSVEQFRFWLTLPPDWRNLVSVMTRYDDLPANQLRMAINYPDPAFAYYYSGEVPKMVLPFKPGDAEGTQRVVEDMKNEGVQRVVLQLVDSWWDNNAVAQTALANHFTKIDEAYSGRWIVQVYGRVHPASLAPVNAQFSNGITLEAAKVIADDKAGLAEVHLLWRGDSSALHDGLKYFIHLTPADNPQQVLGQSDGDMNVAVMTAPINTHGIRLNAPAPSNSYVVRVGLYDASKEGAPRVLTTDGRDAVVLQSTAR